MMKAAATVHGQRTPCQQCPLRSLPHFREFERDELNFISGFKKGELLVDAGATIFLEGAHSAHLSPSSPAGASVTRRWRMGAAKS